MKEVLVIGIGNRLMMDDAIGIYVVEELSGRNTNPSVRYVVGETDFNYCLQQIRESSYIIIIDAANLENKPGDVSIIPLQHVLCNLGQSVFAHEMNLLNEARLMGKEISGIFIGIEPYEVGFSICLSSVLKEQFQRIVDDIENIVSRFVIKIKARLN